jgi:hypothetical protein
MTEPLHVRRQPHLLLLGFVKRRVETFTGSQVAV